MIKELIKIRNSSIIPQGTENEVKSILSLKYDSDPIGSGNFGEVFEVVEINEFQTSLYLIKIIKKGNESQAYQTIKILHDKIKREQLKKETTIYQEFPELLGMPFAVFYTFDSVLKEEVLGLLMFNLKKLGYNDYGTDNTDEFSFNKLELSLRLLPGYQMARTIGFLHRLLFIHADINEAAIWFNQNKLQLSIIDFDSGYNYDKQEKASTLGKLSQWASPWMMNIIRFGKEREITTEDRLAEEYWNFASALFEMLFGLPPFYFLLDKEKKTVDTYLNKNQWPNIAKSKEVVNEKNIPSQQEIIRLLDAYEENGFSSITKLFRVTFNEGHLRSDKRITIQLWESELLKIIKELDLIPDITKLTSDRESIQRKGEEVTFNWESELSNYFTINGYIVPLFASKYSLTLNDQTNVTLIAKNSIAEASKTINIKATKVEPAFNYLRSSRKIRIGTEPIVLTWIVQNAKEVRIEGVINTFSTTDSFNVYPIERTLYKVIAVGYFDQEVVRLVTIDVILPSIKEFDWQIDINKGINNVRIDWETEHATECHIFPNIGQVPISSAIDVKINSKTVFELIAKGLYGQVSRKIEAIPFNAPIVENIFVESPTIELTTNLDIRPISIDTSIPLLLLKNVQLKSYFNLETKTEPIEINFNNGLPDFRYENALLPKTNPAWLYRNMLKVKNKIINLVTKQN